jgi:chemotaxis protein methyltransferase CheR
MIGISDKEFQLLRSLIYERFGINLTEQKRTLVTSRLQKILWKHNFTNYEQYYEYLQKDTSGRALSDLVDRISTNHTYFNREKDHFDFFLNKALPETVQKLKAQNSRDIRIWCAGCSSGEEPYMLLMLMKEYLGSEYGMWDAGILATDISDRALGIAKSGRYNEERVSTIPPGLRNKYFKKQGTDEWLVSEELRKQAVFRRFNLMNTAFPFKKPFHIIFCRNVMIYFDQQTRDALVNRFYRSTERDGYFFIGHSESLGRENCPYRYVMPAVYKKG